MINFTDIRKVRPISENVNDEKRLKPYIEESEKLYLLPAIGAALYKEIDEDPGSFETLYDGGFYVKNEVHKHFAGLREAMGYLTYSRFIRNQNVNATAFGIVQKQSQFSEPVDERTLVRAANEAEKIGMGYLNQCVEYLKDTGKISTKHSYVSKRKFRSIGK